LPLAQAVRGIFYAKNYPQGVFPGQGRRGVKEVLTLINITLLVYHISYVGVKGTRKVCAIFVPFCLVKGVKWGEKTPIRGDWRCLVNLNFSLSVGLFPLFAGAPGVNRTPGTRIRNTNRMINKAIFHRHPLTRYPRFVPFLCHSI
jgi:hypothetical protein